MTLDNFLSFWSHHNTTIIETLIALITVSSLFLGFRHFFVKDSPQDSTGASGGADITQIEQTLKKILENQGTGATAAPPPPAPEPAPPADTGGGGDLLFTAADLQHFRDALDEALVKNDELQKKITSLEQAASAPAPTASAGVDPAIESALKSKISDLESRLKEYELISEDIAELSKFREENARLQKELARLKAGGGSPSVESMRETEAAPEPAAQEKTSLSVVSDPAPEPELAPAPVTEVVPSPEAAIQTVEVVQGSEPVAESIEAQSVVEATPATEAVSVGEASEAVVSSADPVSSAETQTAIDAEAAAAADMSNTQLDEEFLKQFAEVVGKSPPSENTEAVAAPGSGPKDPVASDIDETQKLMSSFESFVANKKE